MSKYQCNTSELAARRAGKSTVANCIREGLLDRGKTVLLVTPKGIVRQKRRKHLALFEKVVPTNKATTVIYDELV